MDIEFDPAKDAVNPEKHGVSLSRFIDLERAVFVTDDRYAEQRFRVHGLIDDAWHCAAITIRAGAFRVISLRRARVKEVKRHVQAAAPS